MRTDIDQKHLEPDECVDKYLLHSRRNIEKYSTIDRPHFLLSLPLPPHDVLIETIIWHTRDELGRPLIRQGLVRELLPSQFLTQRPQFIRQLYIDRILGDPLV